MVVRALRIWMVICFPPFAVPRFTKMRFRILEPDTFTVFTIETGIRGESSTMVRSSGNDEILRYVPSPDLVADTVHIPNFIALTMP